MAFELKLESSFNIENNIFSIMDYSGIYNTTLNNTGYGSPNIAKASVNKAELFITSPTNSVTTVAEADLLNAINNSGNSNIFFIYRNLTGNWIDGKYEIQYGIGIGAIQHQTVDIVYNYAELRKCVYEKFSKFESCTTCSKPDYIYYYALYKSMQFDFLYNQILEGELKYNKIKDWACSSC